MTDPTFLLIDDDQDDHEIFIAAFCDLFPAASCHSCFDCPAAIKFLEEEDTPVVDYICMDWHMPIVEADECIQLLKKANRSVETEILFMRPSGALPGTVINILLVKTHQRPQ